MLPGCPSVRPVVVRQLYVICDSSFLSREILMKLATDFRHVIGHCSKGVQGQTQRSKVKMTR